MRLIDADVLIERLKYSFNSNERVSMETVIGCFLDETGCAPTIDVEPVVHGHWIEGTCGAYKICSVCDQISDFDFDYCPNCGAKMDEVSE